MDRFEIHPVGCCALPEVGAFLGRQLSPRTGIERRLRWLLLDNPAATRGDSFGYCVRDGYGAMRGLSLHFPAIYSSSNKQLRGLGSGSYYVDAAARSLGFYLFKKYLRVPGYSFHFASTCNAVSSELWKVAGGSAVPESETEYVVPLKLNAVIPELVAGRTRSRTAAVIARAIGRAADPALRLVTRTSSGIHIEPCRDWEKLAELSRRHRPPNSIRCERSAEFLEWRYGPDSPLYPCGVYLASDTAGSEGWFALGDLSRGKSHTFREAVLLDAIYPADGMNLGRLFPAILRTAAEGADTISFRGRPGLDFGELRPWAIRRKSATPRAFVITPKGAPKVPVEALEYDDSDYVAWRFD
jgi:hypothetical protein